ncbi:MotA/TolQ/ExbB proton channel family protein [Ectothiorhodospiraceae bacterium WFHF3C12]|nr:MotA/TolQ/ExbB proton channel family protein [Ectothiorhodospiraceae bacterium WFHF3C12]
MSLVLAAVIVICLLLAQPLAQAFMSNAIFNGMILAVLALGVIINFRQVWILSPEARWFRAFASDDVEAVPEPPRTGLLAPAARLLTSRRGEQRSLSTLSMQAVLDGIRNRLDESRDLSRYMTGLLIFLGLLGTFWGLLDTLRSVGDVISALDVGTGNVGEMFRQLKGGLAEPLAGMGTAFSSSLFGLAGALVLGLFDLQAGHAQNRFYNDLEEWLAGQTRLSSGGLGGEGEQSVPAYIQALLENTADSLDKLQRVMSQSETERRSADQRLLDLTEQIANLAEQARSEQKGLLNLTRAQGELQGTLTELSDTLAGKRESDDALSHALRSIDGHLGAIYEEVSKGRQQTVNELRDELRLLSRTLARSSHDSGDRG